MASYTDSFTDTGGTLLQSHTAGSRAWNRHTSFANNMIVSNTPGNTIRPNSGSASFMYYTSDTMATAEYDVSCDLVVVALTTGHATGVAGRVATATNTAYFARYLVGTGLQLFKVVSATSTQLGSTVAGDLTIGQPYTLKLEIRDAAKKLYLNGVEQITSADNAITAAGFPGLRCSSGASTGDGTGIHIDNWVAADPAAAPGASGVTPLRLGRRRGIGLAGGLRVGR